MGLQSAAAKILTRVWTHQALKRELRAAGCGSEHLKRLLIAPPTGRRHKEPADRIHQPQHLLGRRMQEPELGAGAQCSLITGIWGKKCMEEDVICDIGFILRTYSEIISRAGER